MHRFYVPPGNWTEPDPALTGSEAHHALHVLRLKPGDPVTVLNGVGGEFACEIKDSTRNTVALRVREKNLRPHPGFEVTLLQAIPKGKTFDFIVEKATELGVARIIPLVTERVVARPHPDEAQQKVGKWEQSAIAAMKQCGSPWLPKIDPPTTPAQFLAQDKTSELSFVASLAAGARHAMEFFREFRDRHHRHPRSVSVWVGPEGDFSPPEMASIEGGGTLPITLGPLVLRADTAAIYCLSIINYELQQPASTANRA